MKPHVEARSVPITLLDGKPRHLYLGFNALNALVKKLGLDIMDIQAALKGPGMLETVRAVLWAGCIHEDAALTLEDAGDLIDFRKIAELTDAIIKAMEFSFKASGELKNPEKPETEINPSTVPASSGRANGLPTP
jgi:hypothetical protein